MTPQKPQPIGHDDTWRQHSSCLDHPDPDLWFPDDGDQGREGRVICAACPVRDDCLQHALAEVEIHGTWGGASERVRRHLRSLASRAIHGPFRRIDCTCRFCHALDRHDHHMAALLANETIERLDDNGPGARHGTAARYARGCRCEPCRNAMRASRKRNRRTTDDESEAS